VFADETLEQAEAEAEAATKEAQQQRLKLDKGWKTDLSKVGAGIVKHLDAGSAWGFHMVA
jgi:hypothetical protein